MLGQHKNLSQVLWHCWLGNRKSNRLVKSRVLVFRWWCLTGALHVLVFRFAPRLLRHSCYIKIEYGLPFWCQITLVVLEYWSLIEDDDYDDDVIRSLHDGMTACIVDISALSYQFPGTKQGRILAALLSTSFTLPCCWMLFANTTLLSKYNTKPMAAFLILCQLNSTLKITELLACYLLYANHCSDRAQSRQCSGSNRQLEWSSLLLLRQ